MTGQVHPIRTIFTGRKVNIRIPRYQMLTQHTQGFGYERKRAQQRRELLKENPELKREAAGQSKIAQAVMYGTLEQFFLDLDEPAVSQVRGLLSEVCAVEHIYDAKELAKGLGSVITGRSIELVPAGIEPIVA